MHAVCCMLYARMHMLACGCVLVCQHAVCVARCMHACTCLLVLCSSVPACTVCVCVCVCVCVPTVLCVCVLVCVPVCVCMYACMHVPCWRCTSVYACSAAGCVCMPAHACGCVHSVSRMRFTNVITTVYHMIPACYRVCMACQSLHLSSCNAVCMHVLGS